MTSKVGKYMKFNNGVMFPTTGLGTWETPNRITANVVYNALKTGYRLIDTATMYGNEAECGDGIMQWIEEDPSHKREDVFYITKLWNDENGYDVAKRAIKEAMARVKGLQYIDLLLIHSPLEGSKLRLGTWEAMQEAVDEGIVKSIGVSNYGQKHIEELLNWDKLKYKPVVNEIEISPWLMRQELCDYCRSVGVEIIAYAPLARSQRLSDPCVVKVAKELNVTPAQVLIRWALQKGYMPIPKTKTVSRLAGNFDVYSFELSKAQVESIDHPMDYDPTDWECTNCP